MWLSGRAGLSGRAVAFDPKVMISNPSPLHKEWNIVHKTKLFLTNQSTAILTGKINQINGSIHVKPNQSQMVVFSPLKVQQFGLFWSSLSRINPFCILSIYFIMVDLLLKSTDNVKCEAQSVAFTPF